jgi:hypothetical protein
MNWKESGWKRPWPVWNNSPRTHFEWLRKIAQPQESKCPSRDSKQVPSESYLEALSSERSCSVSNFLFVHLFINGYRPLLGPGLFFSFVIFFTQTVGLPGQVISPSQGRYLHTGQHKHRINAHRHPCLDWNSNPWFQLPRGRRQFMP